jgi:NAD+ kinase
MQVLVYTRSFKASDLVYIQELFDVLLATKNLNVYVYHDFLTLIHGKVKFIRDVGDFQSTLDFKVHPIDLIITLGGDGTILETVGLVENLGIPVIGFNLGRLGFLAVLEKGNITSALEKFFRGEYYVEERSLLFLESNFDLFNGNRTAMNDFTILKRDTSSMITIHTFINGEYLNSYWADGLIVATPTGSTGYNLSCGGPIIFPQSNNFVITPVAPHNLSVRPMVIPDNAIVSFEIEGRADSFLCTLDSRFETITSAHQIAIRKNEYSMKLIQLNDNSFLKTIRKKLSWGMDQRNT